MSVYVIGDVQGCLASLDSLLSRLPLVWGRDKLWFVGDIVNRGPDSLGTLRFIHGLGDRAVVVLGNHDFHLLCRALGGVAQRRGDTLDDILGSPDAARLLTWLRSRPLVHHEQGTTLVHAGLLPQWTVSQAVKLSREVEAVLAGPEYVPFLTRLYGDEPRQWDDGLENLPRWRTIVNACTRMRICSSEGAMQFDYKGPLDAVPEGYHAWFEVPGRRSQNDRVVFGHWSALGLRISGGAIALDTGCVWGGALTAFRLEDGAIFQASGGELPGSTNLPLPARGYGPTPVDGPGIPHS